jgi:D-alanine-D-alanine ligase
MEYDVVRTLKVLGHELQRDRRARRPDADPQHDGRVQADHHFNLMEAFDDIIVFDQNVVSYLELLKVRTRDAIRAA